MCTDIRPAKAGFSLVEILVVLVIVGLMLFMVVPATQRILKTELRSTLRKMGAIAQAAYSEAALTQRIYRLAIDFDSNRVWVEQGPSGPTTWEAPSDDKKKDVSAEQSAKEDANFVRQDEPYMEPFDIPEGVEIEDIVNLAWYSTPVSEGVAYVFFYPHGEMDGVLMHLKDRWGQDRFTLEFSPVSGAPRYYTGYVWFEGKPPPEQKKKE